MKQDVASRWAKGMPASFFATTNTDQCQAEYHDLWSILRNHGQYTDEAKYYFLERADCWLVAYAMAMGATLVTHETLDTNAKNKIKIPNMCKMVGASYCDLFTMLEKLQVRFVCHTESA